MPKQDQLTDELQTYSDRLADCVAAINLVEAAVENHPLLPGLAVDEVEAIKTGCEFVKANLVKMMNVISQDMIPF